MSFQLEESRTKESAKTRMAEERALELNRWIPTCALVCALFVLATLYAQPYDHNSAVEAPTNEFIERHFPGGATLKTDPEKERLIQRAEQCVADGRLDLAVVLWQSVLNDAGDHLVVQKLIQPHGPDTSPLVIYRSLAQHVERALAKLPPESLAVYRTTADAEARALLAAAAPDGEEAALAQIVRRFFLSSIGDDAAFKLACLALDRHDFVAANRWLEKIIAEHPDPSMPRSELIARLAVAAAHLPDERAAEKWLAELASLRGTRVPAGLFDLIAAEVKAAGAATLPDAIAPPAEWRMAYGNRSRTGVMAELSTIATDSTLTESWIAEFPPADQATARDELIAHWRAGGWHPAGRLALDAERVYVKTLNRLVCYNAKAPAAEPLWQSAWENRYELDGLSRQIAMIAHQTDHLTPRQANAKPMALEEIQLFGDRVQGSLTVSDGVVYSLEGQRSLTSDNRSSAGQAFQWGNSPRRTRRNWLTAYQATGGKALWTRAVGDKNATDAGEGGFLSAPTPCGNLLLVPVTEGGTISLLGLDPTTGQTAWKTYLCDEPAGNASPWAEIVLAASGREAYLSCGCGIVFAIDGTDGAVQWAVRYARDGKPNAALRQVYGPENSSLELSGWDDDVVIPYGRVLIVMPSDSDRLLALDRQTGERLWEATRASSAGSLVNYCLGVRGQSLFVAGKNAIRRYEIASGRLQGERAIGDSFGRGCLTANAVYLPVNDSILKLDLELTRELNQVPVALSGDEPVGNLLSDGQKLWGIGARRVYALTTLDQRLELLAQQIAAGDAIAQLQRMRLHLKQNRPDLAVADLRGAYTLFESQISADVAAQRVIAALSELKLPQTQPLLVLSLLAELPANRLHPEQLSPETRMAKNELVASSINSIRRNKPAGAVTAILAAAPLLDEEFLVAAASSAIDAVAGEADVVALRAALDRGAPVEWLISLPAAVRLARSGIRPVLHKQLSSGDDRLALAAARALANLGEQPQVLETLLRLLGSNQVPIRMRSQQTLIALTGQQIPFAPEGSVADRAATTNAWRQWIDQYGPTARFMLPLAERASPLGRTLIVAPGAVIELDADHKSRWQTRLAGSAWGCQGLPNGHRLVAVNSHSMVIEYDAAGQEVWRKDRLPAPPTSVERLASGNTLITCGSAQQIVEIAPDGTLVATLNVPGLPISAERLDSGNTLVALQKTQRIVEVNPAGQIVWEARTGGAAPYHAVRLNNGNTLVTLTQARTVVEYDPTGQTIVWSTQTPLIKPVAAQRLASGNTLVADATGVREIDATGKQVLWQHRQSQVTGLSSF